MGKAQQGYISNEVISHPGVALAESTAPPKRPVERLNRWLLEHRIEDVPGPEKIKVDETAQRFIDEASGGEEIHIVANRRQSGDARDYNSKEREQRQYTYIPSDVILCLEVDVADPSEFEDVLEVRGVEVNGYWVLRAESSTVPNAIAAFLLHVRDTAGKETHCHFDWTQGNPLGYLLRYLLLGEGSRPRSPTKHSGKPWRTLNGAPSSTSPANELARASGCTGQSTSRPNEVR